MSVLVSPHFLFLELADSLEWIGRDARADGHVLETVRDGADQGRQAG